MNWKHIQKTFLRSPERLFAGFVFLILLFIISALASARIAIWLEAHRTQPPQQHLPVASNTTQFSLTPEKQTVAGVPTNTSFILQSSESLDKDAAAKSFDITPKIELAFTQKDSQNILIAPTKNFAPDTVYTFSLLTEQSPDTENQTEKKYSWAYQTQKPFTLITTSPAHTSIDISPKTPLTLTFSHAHWNVEGVQKHISINPSVEGTFTKQNSTLIFTPKTAWPETRLITVTINKDTADETGTVFGTDTQILFEAGRENLSLEDVTKTGLLTFENTLAYGRPNENMTLNFNLIPEGTNRTANKTRLCTFALTEEKFLEELTKIHTFPEWVGYGRFGYIPETLPQDQRCSEKNLTPTKSGATTTIDALPAGWYGVTSELPNEPTSKQFTLINISPLSVFSDTLDNAVVLWAHNGDEAANDARVKTMGTEQTFSLNGEGLAHWKAPEGTQNVIFKIEKGASIYAPVHLATNSLHADMHTDKITYNAGEILRLWGNITSSTTGFPELSLRIEKQNTPTLFGYSYTTLDAKKLSSPELFFESFATANLKKGNYRATIATKNTPIITKNFTITESLPNLSLSLTTNKSTILSGETIQAEIHAQNANGEPIASIALLDEQNKTIATTDINGNASFATQLFAEDIFTPSLTQTITIKTHDEKFGDASATTQVTVFAGNILAKIDEEKIQDDTAIITVSAHELNPDWNDTQDSEDVYGKPLQDEFITAGVSYLKNEPTKNGVTQKKIDLESRRLVTDENGQAKLTFAAEPNTPYTITLRTRDEEGRVAMVQAYAFDTTRTTNNATELKITDTHLARAEKTKLMLMKNSETLKNSKPHALLLKKQDVYQIIKTQNTAEWSLSATQKDEAGFTTTTVWYEQGKYTPLTFSFPEAKKTNALSVKIDAKKRVQAGGEQKFRITTERNGTGVPAKFIFMLADAPLSTKTSLSIPHILFSTAGQTNDQGIIDLPITIPTFTGTTFLSVRAVSEKDSSSLVTPQGHVTQTMEIYPPFSIRILGDTTFTPEDAPHLSFALAGNEEGETTITLRIPELVFQEEKKIAKQTATFELPSLEKGTYPYTVQVKQNSLETTITGTLTIQKNLITIHTIESIPQEKNFFTISTNTETIFAIPKPYEEIYTNANNLLLPPQSDFEHLLASREAAENIKTLFGSDALLTTGAFFDAHPWQNEDGGFTNTPRGQSNVRISAYAALLQTGDINTAKLLSFLISATTNPSNSTDEKIFALAGLRALGENILLDLNDAVNSGTAGEEANLLALWLYQQMGAQTEARVLAQNILLKNSELTDAVDALTHNTLPPILNNSSLLSLHLQKSWAQQNPFLPFSTTVWWSNETEQHLAFTEIPFVKIDVPKNITSVSASEPNLTFFSLKTKTPYSGLPGAGKDLVHITRRPFGKTENGLFQINALGIMDITYAQKTPGTCVSVFTPKTPGAHFTLPQPYSALIADQNMASTCANENPSLTFTTGSAGSFSIPNFTLADQNNHFITPTETDTLIIYEE